MIDLDGPEAHSWWASQGFPDGAMVRTPRVGGGTHHYFRVDEVEIQTDNAGKVHAGVDIRGEGGLAVGPGSIVATGVYKGDLSHVPDLPDEVLAILPEKQTFQYEIQEGEKPEHSSEDERRQVNAIVKELQGLPEVWREGAGWHETVYRTSCWLARMVNSPAYSLTEDQAAQILLTHTPVYPDWREDKIIEQWESARKSTAGQYADVPIEQQPKLLPILEVAEALPTHTSTGDVFTDLVFFEPTDDRPSARFERRKVIISEAFRAGLSAQQAASLAWNAKAAIDLQNDPQGFPKLWREVDSAKAAVARESTAPLAPVIKLTPKGRALSLLTDEERAFVLSEEGNWFGTRYLDWAEESVSVLNAPYHRMNRWTILALILSPHGVMPLDGGIEIKLNLYQMVLGETTTGKSESVKLMKSVLKAFYAAGDSPDIGGNATPISLYTKLIERDGKASWFHKDEAHGQIYEMKNTGYLKEMPTALTDLYEGEVPMFLRAGNKDLSGVDASTYFTIHYMGTIGGMSDVIEAADWESGFLNRFVWAVGEQKEQTREAMRLKHRRGGLENNKPANLMQKQWAAEFTDAIRRTGSAEGRPAHMQITEEIDDRHLDAKEEMLRFAKGHEHASRLRPTFERLSLTVLKCACLVALSEGKLVVERRHLLIALHQVEEWAENIIMMIGMTDETPFSRQVGKLETMIRTQLGREVDPKYLYRKSPWKKKETDELLAQLEAEGRIGRRAEGTIYITETKEAAA